jgi:hypothetical protein
MSKKAVTHWNTPTQNDGKVQTLGWNKPQQAAGS